MTEEEKAIEANAQAIALEEQKKKEAEANAQTPEQLEIAALRAEKDAILEREANYKLAYLKEVKKNEELGNPEESEEDKIRRIYREEQARERLNQIDAEEKALLEKTLKENKELKLAIQNKPSSTPTGGSGGNSEIMGVRDTIVTPEQETALRNRGWTDKDIERYKHNLRKNSR